MLILRRSFSSFLIALLFPILRAQSPFFEVWMETRLAGQPAGYFHERTAIDSRVGAVTISESRIVINRLGSKVEIQSKGRSAEDANGRLTSIHSELSSSAQTTTIDGSVADGSITLSITTGGKTYHRTVALTRPLTGTEGARRLALQRLKAPGDSVSYDVFSADLGVVQTVTRTVSAIENGVIKVEETLTGLPGKASVWLNPDACAIRRIQSSPFGEIEMVETTQDRAMAAASGATLPAEAFKSSVIRSNIRLPQERKIESLRVRITHKRPELGWPDFASEHQSIVEQSPKSVVLEIRRPVRDALQAGFSSPDDNLKRYLAPNALFQSDDKEVQNIAQQVVAGKTDRFAAAVALRDWTSKNMRFDAGIAVAPASEVIRNRAGTCFGYSIVLGSLARAADIPSRMKMGFVYTGGAWAGHAWIEVFVRGQWLPFDAALTSPAIADAARISFFTGSLEEGTISGLGSLAQMFGNVEITVLRFTVSGREVSVPPGSPAFTIRQNQYINSWLGVRIVKPESFRFVSAESVWPETTLIALEGPRTERLSLERIPHSAGKDAETQALVYLKKNGISGERHMRRISGRRDFQIISSTGHKAALVALNSDETWVLKADAPNAEALLNGVGAKLRLPAEGCAT